MRSRGFVAACVCLCMVLIFSDTHINVKAETDYVLTDSTKNQINLLTRLEVLRGYDEQNVNLLPNVTRAEYIDTIMRILYPEKSSDFSGSYREGIFFDVSPEHWAYDNIQTAARLGYINGYSDGSFRPDEIVNFGEAVKMMVCALGLDIYIQDGQKNYISAYLQTAVNKKLTNGNVKSLGSPLHKYDAAYLFYNMLNMELVDILPTGDRTTVTYVKNETLLSNKFKVYKGNGIVNGNNKTLLNSESHIGASRLLIGTELYVMSEYINSDYLGYSVEFFYRYDEETSSNKTLITLYPFGSHTNVLTIFAKDIMYSDSRFSLSSLIYSVNDKARQANITSDSDLIYNGKLYTGYDKSIFDIKNGNVELIDNNGDGHYDVVFINEYRNIFVQSVNSSKKIIYSKYGTGGDFSQIDDNNISITDLNGKNVLMSSIGEYNVLSVMTAKDNSITTAVLSKSSVSGQVSGRFTDDGKDYIVIDGKEYTFDPEYVAAAGVDTRDILLGNDYIIYLDMNGQIAGMKGDSFKKYAYFLKAHRSDNIDNVLKFKLFTSDGKFTVFEGAERMLIDGYSVSSIEKQMPISDYFDPNGELVALKVNSDGKAIYIDTVRAGLNENDENLKFGGNLDGKYRNTIFHLQYRNDENSVVFAIPEDITKEKEFQVKPFSYFVNDSMYKMQVYDCDECNLFKAAVMKSGNDEMSITEYFTVIEKVSVGVNEEDEKILIITGIRNKAFGKFVIKLDDYDTSSIETIKNGIRMKDEAGKYVTLQGGDVLRCFWNNNDEITYFEKVFQRSGGVVGAQISPEFPEYGSLVAQVHFMYGMVTVKSGTAFKIQAQTGAMTEMALDASKLRYTFAKWEEKTGKLKIATMDDVFDAKTAGDKASYMLVRTNNNMVEEFVILDFSD